MRGGSLASRPGSMSDEVWHCGCAESRPRAHIAVTHRSRLWKRAILGDICSGKSCIYTPRRVLSSAVKHQRSPRFSATRRSRCVPIETQELCFPSVLLSLTCGHHGQVPDSSVIGPRNGPRIPCDPWQTCLMRHVKAARYCSRGWRIRKVLLMLARMQSQSSDRI